MRHSTRNNLMTNQTKIMFGRVARDLETFVDQSQFVQAEAMKTFCEVSLPSAVSILSYDER